MKKSELRQIIREEIKLKLKEGLESHIDTVIERDAPELSNKYHWSNGLNVKDKNDALEIMKVLDNSREFGTTSYKNGKIYFGTWKESLREDGIFPSDSEASDQAKKLGLVYAGYGRWEDPKTMKIVAKTIDGKLYKTQEAEPEKTKAEPEKPKSEPTKTEPKSEPAKTPTEKPTERPTKKPEEKPEKPATSEPAKPAYTKPIPGKKTPDDADILIPGFGVVKHSLAKKQLAKKIEDLTQRAAKGDFATIGKGNFENLAAWWETLARHSGEKR